MMSETDMIVILILCVFVIIFVSLTHYIWGSVFPNLPQTGPAGNVTQTMDTMIQNNTSFWNNSLGAVYLMLGLGSILLTVLIRSHPVFLVAWILFNLVVLMVYDQMLTVVNIYVGSAIYDGSMSTAVSFFVNDVGLLIPVLNMVLAIVLLGKKVFE